jgi:NAD(P)-dependent dehydrogenase (short-subunit alcohol dehydrogenase family)
MPRVAFVTGASSGLGAGLARRFAAAGWSVALAARRLDLLHRLAADIEAGGGRAVACSCDVTRRDDVHAALEAAERGLGPVDLLVANAGISVPTRVETLDAESVEKVLRVNFLGAVYAVEAALPHMLRRRRGHLVAMGSIAGYGGLPRTAAYSASKGALHNFFESLRLDLRGTGVQVTILTPGYVKTDLTRKSLHRMPRLLDLEPAVERMYRAIAKRKRLLSFPRPLSTAAWLGQIVPAILYDALASRVRRDKAD